MLFYDAFIYVSKMTSSWMSYLCFHQQDKENSMHQICQNLKGKRLLNGFPCAKSQSAKKINVQNAQSSEAECGRKVDVL